MSCYSALRRDVEEHANAQLSKHYLELWSLLNGDDWQREEHETAKSINHTSKKNRKVRKKSYKADQHCSTPPTMVYSTHFTTENDRQAEEKKQFELWLKRKNTEIRKAKKKALLKENEERITAKLEEIKKRERQEKGERAFQKWLNDKIHETKGKGKGKGKFSHESSSQESYGKEIFTDDNEPKLDLVESDDDTLSGELLCNSNRSTPKPTFEDDEEVKSEPIESPEMSHTTQDESPFARPDCPEPRSSSVEKPKKSENLPTRAKTAVSDDHSIRNEKIQAELKKKISFDEWLKATQATIAQEEKELRESIEKMRKAKLHAKQRVEKILINENSQSPNLKRNSSIKTTGNKQKKDEPRKSPRARKLSYDELRQEAARLYDWAKKGERQPQSSTHNLPTFNAETKSNDKGDILVEPELRGQTPKVTHSLEETSIDATSEFFALTSLS